MNYSDYGAKKLISVRVSEKKYDAVMAKLKDENKDKYWYKSSFGDLVDKMMDDYLNKKK